LELVCSSSILQRYGSVSIMTDLTATFGQLLEAHGASLSQANGEKKKPLPVDEFLKEANRIVRPVPLVSLLSFRGAMC
jgi:hypothetical protein